MIKTKNEYSKEVSISRTPKPDKDTGLLQDCYLKWPKSGFQAIRTKTHC